MNIGVHTFEGNPSLTKAKVHALWNATAAERRLIRRIAKGSSALDHFNKLVVPPTLAQPPQEIAQWSREVATAMTCAVLYIGSKDLVKRKVGEFLPEAAHPDRTISDYIAKTIVPTISRYNNFATAILSY